MSQAPCPTPDQILDAAGGAADGAFADIAGVALALAAGPLRRQEIAAERDHVQEMAAGFAARLGEGAPVADAPAALADVIADAHGYRGDDHTYDDLRNANLIQVMERRRGLPVALGILYMAVARSAGLAAVGLGFPGHFLVRLGSGDNQAIIDPFHGGRVLNTPHMRALLKAISGLQAELARAHYAAVSDRAVLLRLQDNIRLRAERADDPGTAREAVGGMIRIAPREARLFEQLALLALQSGELGAAIEAARRLTQLSDDTGQRHRAAELLAHIRKRLN